MKSLKEVYNMEYDDSGFNSGLIIWYNKLIDKTYEEINTEDVLRMIRQNILKDVAKRRIIDLFIKNPYDGYVYDGELLNIIVEQNIMSTNIVGLKRVIADLEKNVLDYEWDDNEEKNLFMNNIIKLKSKYKFDNN